MHPIIARPLTREQVRSIDSLAIERYGMHGLVLMENAGRGAAEVIDRLAPPGKISILCGKGNNAGDGYVIARHLQLAEREVQVVQLYDPHQLTGDALANWQILRSAEIPTRIAAEAPAEWLRTALADSATVVDAMLGTGASGAPREPLATAVRVANPMPALRFAVDIPSGLDCNTGQPAADCFRAHHTCTFVAAKTGFAAPEAPAFTGAVHVLSIGVPLKLLQSLDVA